MRFPHILLLISVALLLSCSPAEPGAPSSQSQSSSPAAQSDMIRVTSPEAGDHIESPITVAGEARGMWYAEGSFPVELVDLQGKPIAQGTAEAQGDWMTEEFVPFIAELTFQTNLPAGTLVLRRENLSGDPENDASIWVSVYFD